MKLPDWKKRFRAIVRESLNIQFSWGSHDCVLFPAKCAEAITGIEYRSEIRSRFGEWSTASEAIEVIERGGGLTKMVSDILGEPIPWGWCGSGDVLLINDQHGREMLTVHDGINLVAPTKYGLQTFPVSWAIKGWKL